MRSLEQRARARLGDLLRGYELDAMEDMDVLSARFTGRAGESTASVCILHERWRALPGFAGSFARAAWLTQTFDHSVVPRVLDSGVTEDRVPFVVFEWIGGETLAAYMRRRGDTVPPSEALRIVGLLADGLTALAAQGAVHGAIQPHSIALTDTGAVRLLHLGWSRVREQAAAHLGQSLLPNLSGYLSPNRARGDAPTHQDDLWSISAILYELLTGVALRSGETDDERLTEARHWEAPSLRTACPSAPDALVELLDAALHPVSTERIQGAAEFGSRCRLIASAPEIARMRRLSIHARPASTPVRGVSTRPSNALRGHSGVSALNLPDQATGTLPFQGRHQSNVPRPAAGRYSSADLRVDTLHPKKG
jgi:serine/threonine protein kinase